MRVLELYSGIGGMHFAFQESNVEGSVVAAVEINTVANEVYRHNFPNVTLINRNIESMSVEEINKLNIDTILMSPPCQPFTKVGLQKDALDNRSNSLFHILEIIPQLESLKYILLENVRGFETSETRNSVIQCLNKSNFNFHELILSPCQFGVPNSRHRYYLLAKKKEIQFIFNSSILSQCLNKEIIQILPQSHHQTLIKEDKTITLNSVNQCYSLKHVLEDCNNSEHLVPQSLLLKRAKVLDIRCAEDRGSCCFTKAYSRYIEGTGSIYCPLSKDHFLEKYNEFKLKKIINEQEEFLLNLNLRFFTPKEVSRLMCFPENFTFPSNITNKQKYRLLGNSINVYVVSRLIFLLHYENECS